MPEIRQPVAPPPEAVAYLDGKGFRPAFHWTDVWGEEHAFQYTVAKATEMDVLKALRQATDRAVKEGVPFEQFRQELTPTLQGLGWWGRQERADSLTGELRQVQLGSPRRLKTIYWANTRSAYAAGQWERAQRTKKALPYFVYELGPSEEHRPMHAAIARRPTVLPVDDPYWRTHYPPNGWGCKCRLRQITKRAAESIGISNEAPTIEYRIYRNKRTGRETAIPIDVDPGWHTNPGLARARTLMDGLTARIEEAGEAEARSAIGDLWAGRGPEAFAKLPPESRVKIPVAISTKAIDRVGGKGSTIMVDSQTVAAKTAKHAAVSVASFGDVQRLLDASDAVVDRPDGSVQFWQRREEGWFVAALAKSAAGFVRLATLFRSDEKRLASARRVERRLRGEE